ncbi:MAG: ArsR/SmtB family transcription factor [Bacillota bacterium]
MTSQQERSQQVLAALADPVRLQLLRMIAARGASTATDLAGDLPISRQAVVKHLGVLDAAGLVQHSRVGREVRYSVQPGQLSDTARWMAGMAEMWDRKLKAIKDAAEKRTESE